MISTSQTSKDSSPDERPELEKNYNTIVPPETIPHKHSSSIPKDVGPVSEVTPRLSPHSVRPEPTSKAGSQTSPMEKQPSSDAPESWDRFAEPDDDKPYRRPKEISLPEVTISAFTETGQQESSIIIPKQRAYTDRKPVISSHLADTPCATLGIQGLLDQLNTTLGTSHSLDTPSLSSLLEECITENWDFGTAYSRLRRIWYTRNWSTIRDRLRKWEEEHREKCRKALVGNQIVRPYRPQPRRVWDLYSNRVVPWYWTGILSLRWSLLPISHAWMDEKDRIDVQTPINRYEWPVSIPKDTNLSLVRIETLNISPGVEYAWLDVLCLRQKGGQREDMRMEEWKLDVPTIGNVYAWAHVVIYLSGLGRPLSLKDGDLDSDRSWFRRAWTVQEVGQTRIIAGDMPDGPLHAEDKDGKYETELLTRFHKQLQSMDHTSIKYGLDALEAMQTRVSTNPVDKVAGLAFRLMCKRIPAYYESASLEEAWTALVTSMNAKRRGRMFVLYPEPGNAGRKWRPSWDQLMTMPLPVHPYNPDIDIDQDEEIDEDSCNTHCIEKGLVRGLAVVEGGHRRGELIVKGNNGMEHRFNVMATHEYPIPEDTYTLICAGERKFGQVPQIEYWVVGRRLSGERFEKVSVFEMTIAEWRRLEGLHITKECRNILV